MYLYTDVPIHILIIYRCYGDLYMYIHRCYSILPGTRIWGKACRIARSWVMSVKFMCQCIDTVKMRTNTYMHTMNWHAATARYLIHPIPNNDHPLCTTRTLNKGQKSYTLQCATYYSALLIRSSLTCSCYMCVTVHIHGCTCQQIRERERERQRQRERGRELYQQAISIQSCAY